MVTKDEAVALAFLAYLVLPLVLFLIWWLFGLVRRHVFKKGLEDEAAEPEN